MSPLRLDMDGLFGAVTLGPGGGDLLAGVEVGRLQLPGFADGLGRAGSASAGPQSQKVSISLACHQIWLPTAS